MTHLDDAALVALRDAESSDPAVEAHLETCPQCQESLREARARAAAIAELLGSLPGASDPALAKARVRRRLDIERARRPARFPVGLRRAAAILALSAGAAYAMPGSPVPGWIGLGEEEVELEPEAVPADVTDLGGEVPQEALIVPVGDRLEVRVEGLAPGRDVEVLWLEGTTAWITAGPGARFTVGDASTTVHTPDGPVRVGLPSSAPWVVLRVNGRTVFEGTSGGSTDGRMVFPAPGA